jgi:hypothetical protein
MQRNIGVDLGVAAWFLFVGVVGTLYPPSSPTAAIVGFALAVVVVPALTLTVGAFGVDPWRARGGIHQHHVAPRVPAWRRYGGVLPTLFRHRTRGG